MSYIQGAIGFVFSSHVQIHLYFIAAALDFLKDRSKVYGGDHTKSIRRCEHAQRTQGDPLVELFLCIECKELLSGMVDGRNYESDIALSSEEAAEEMVHE